MIRVLHYIGSLGSGGSQAMIMNIYKNIDKTRIQFDFISHDEKSTFYLKEIEQLGGRVFYCPKYTGKNHLSYKKWWDNFFLSHDEYHIFHCHVRSTSSICIRSAKKFKLITIAHSHSTSNGSGIVGIIKSISQFPTRFYADYYFACSKQAGKWMFGKKIIQSSKFYVINNSINAKKYIFNAQTRETVRKNLNLENKFVVGHIGRFMEAKNHPFLIDLLLELKKNNTDPLLLLVGDGPNKRAIENKVKELHLSENVCFLGLRSDIPELLQAMDVFVFPSIYEGMPVTMIEAQASGLKVFCSSVITNEAIVTPLVRSIELNDGPEEWARIILDEVPYKRENQYDSIVKANYDSEMGSKKLESFYLSLH